GEALELDRGLLVRVVALERGLQHVERALLIADLALVDLRDLVEDRDLLLDLGAQLAALEQDLDELGPLVLLAIDRLEAIGRRGIRRIRAADALVDLRGLGQILDLLFPRRRRLEQRLAALGLVVEDERALLEHVDRLFPATLAREQPLEGRERAEV